MKQSHTSYSLTGHTVSNTGYVNELEIEPTLLEESKKYSGVRNNNRVVYLTVMFQTGLHTL